jgi:hypothetical protein
MAKRRLPDISPTALGRLVEGMTPKEVEAIVGRYIRPNTHNGHRFYAWIGDGGMLRAFFEGPAGTLSKVILDVTEEARVLSLCGNLRRRVKNCTIIRTWNCIKCRRRFRRSALPPLACPACHQVCEHIPFGFMVPTPRRKKAWDEFWTQYKTEKALLDAYAVGELRESVKLEIFGINLRPKVPARRGRRRSG